MVICRALPHPARRLAPTTNSFAPTLRTPKRWKGQKAECAEPEDFRGHFRGRPIQCKTDSEDVFTHKPSGAGTMLVHVDQAPTFGFGELPHPVPPRRADKPAAEFLGQPLNLGGKGRPWPVPLGGLGSDCDPAGVQDGGFERLMPRHTGSCLAIA